MLLEVDVGNDMTVVDLIPVPIVSLHDFDFVIDHLIVQMLKLNQNVLSMVIVIGSQIEFLFVKPVQHVHQRRVEHNEQNVEV